MAARAHVYARFAEAIRGAFERASPGRELVCWSTPEQFAAGIEDVEYILVLRPPGEHWARARKLRLLQCLGAGVDDVLPARGLRDEVAIANLRGVAAPSMSEYALALVLMLLKDLPRAIAAQRERRWSPFLPGRAGGRTLGILGLGAIGQALAEKARALGLRVIGTQRSPKPVPAVDRVFAPEDTAQVLAESDVVVVLLPLTPETRGFLDESLLAKLKPGAALVNLARGGIVDERALERGLRSGAIGAAAFDVFAEEPLPPSSPLWDAPNLLITPHIAGGFPNYLEELARIYADNIHRIETGQPIRNPIDRVRGY